MPSGGWLIKGLIPKADLGMVYGASGAGKDPHVWLDPTRLAAIGDQLAQRLGKADKEHSAKGWSAPGGRRAATRPKGRGAGAGTTGG